VETAHVAGDAGDGRDGSAEMALVFAEGNEMDFVVDEDALALRSKSRGAVVRQESARGDNGRGVHWRFPFDGSHENGWPKRIARARLSSRIENPERRKERGFRPNEEVGLFGGRGQADRAISSSSADALEPIRRIGFGLQEN